MAFISIGNGYTNVADPLTGHGSVSDIYEIDQYEITNSQWNAFVSAADAPTGNDGGYNETSHFTNANQPVNNVSWYEAIQYCNWLTSGDDKSKGAYLFSGNNSNPGTFLGIDRTTAKSTYSTIYVLPTLDEWYKAAFYSTTTDSYFLFSNGTNTPPTTSETNYNTYTAPWAVGSGLIEQNGTYDMMGNVWEWTETLIAPGNRGIRGGSYGKPFVFPPPKGYTDLLQAGSAALMPLMTIPTYFVNICSRRTAGLAPHKELPYVGFRIVKL